MSPFGDIDNQFFGGFHNTAIFRLNEILYISDTQKEAKIIGVCKIFFFSKKNF